MTMASARSQCSRDKTWSVAADLFRRIEPRQVIAMCPGYRTGAVGVIPLPSWTKKQRPGRVPSTTW